MELRYRQEATVGLLVIAAVVVLLTGLIWLRGDAVARRSVRRDASFASASGLRKGDPVLISGVVAGRVESVVLRGLGDVVVTLAVPPEYPPRTDAWAAVRAEGFVGEVMVDYFPGMAETLLPDTATIPGRASGGLMGTVDDLAQRADELLVEAPEILARLSTDLHGALQATERAMNVFADVGSGPAVGQLEGTLESFERAANRLDSTLASPDLNRAIAGLDELTERMNEMVTGMAGFTVALSSVMTKVDSGQGTIGKFVNDSTLYNDFHELTQALTALLIDLRERPGRYLTVKVF